MEQTLNCEIYEGDDKELHTYIGSSSKMRDKQRKYIKRRKFGDDISLRKDVISLCSLKRQWVLSLSSQAL